MKSVFDILEKIDEVNFRWLEATQDLQSAKSRIEERQALSPSEYVILDQGTQQLLSDRPRQARFVRNLAVGSVRPKHLFDQNFDHDYFFELPLTRERDAPSSGRRHSARHVRYRAVPRTNRTSAPSSRAYQPKTARVERRRHCYAIKYRAAKICGKDLGKNSTSQNTA